MFNDSYTKTSRFAGNDQLNVATDRILTDTGLHPGLVQFIARLKGWFVTRRVKSRAYRIDGHSRPEIVHTAEDQIHRARVLLIADA